MSEQNVVGDVVVSAPVVEKVMNAKKVKKAKVVVEKKPSTRRDYTPIRKYVSAHLGGALALQKVIENTDPVPGSKDHWFDCYYVLRMLVKTNEYKFVKTEHGIGIAGVGVIKRCKLEGSVKLPRGEKAQVAVVEKVEEVPLAEAAKVEIVVE
jgi:hypothetical protein